MDYVFAEIKYRLTLACKLTLSVHATCPSIMILSQKIKQKIQ